MAEKYDPIRSPDRKIKFRFFCPPAKSFIESYNYNGAVDDLFNGEDPVLIPSQYTGLDDSNNKEIYEGDILIFQNSRNETIKSVIEYKHGSFVASIIDATSTLNFIFLHQLGPAKVVGNRFENPDLI